MQSGGMKIPLSFSLQEISPLAAAVQRMGKHVEMGPVS